MDIFGQPINLNLDLNTKYKSSFGGMISIFIILLLVIYSVNEIVGYTIQRGIQITQETKFSYDPDLLELNHSNFIFAIKVNQEDYYNSPSFDITVNQRYQRGDSSIQLQQCNLEQFTSLVNSDKILKFLESNQMEMWLCPTSQFSIQLEGTQYSSAFKSLAIDVGKCEGLSSWGKTCQEMKENEVFQLQFITKNTFINPFNNEFVAEDYLDNSMSLQLNPGDLQRIDYHFDKHITKDFQGQLKIEGLLDDENLSVFSTNSFRQLYEGKNDGVWTRIVFMRSNFSTNYNREYQTITDLLSKIGGLSQSVISIVGVIITYYNRTQFYLEISNRLYDYDFNTESDQGTKGSGLVDPFHVSAQTQQEGGTKTKRRKADEVKQNEEKQDSMEEDPQYKERVMKVVEEQKKIMEKYKFKSRKHFLLSSFQQTIMTKKSINLNLKYFLYGMCCKKASYKTDHHLFLLQKSLNSVRQELDVEKLKQILLDRDQLILFNYTPKPVIGINEKDKETNFLHYSKQLSLKQMSLIEVAEQIKQQMKSSFLNKENLSIESVFNSYKAIAAKNRKSNRYYYKINRKLKLFLGDQVKAIFKASKILKFPEDDHVFQISDLLSIGEEMAIQIPLQLNPQMNINQQHQ
ncbi:unnamed protein product (macronuclear) [Paramecium tetraurelia]|uniref:Transmembrane protein n=1 Tax=Paramecium tetraurelia TaxID=5888 RepID=A0CAU1_PARTE|nr:uncharacterized protein GSPATT00036689001 [Paramecium tetraurelia]CAK67908.1 unnamed protein product [Paramecium tetraurelia]|eukprot:XP_001435305.1 hypothetical protein (macronuclear) [Paramecium tetraurelia strain d4-2]